MSATTSSRPPRLRYLLALVLVLIPLVAGAVFAAVQGFDPARAWSSEEERTGAPAVGVDPSLLVDARRASNEAKAQAGFLETGANQLSDGTSQLSEGSTELAGGVTQLKQGAQALADGLVQLQAGTGQLGDGATELANGVQAAVDQVVGLEAVKGQLQGAVDRAIEDLEGNDNPEAVTAKEQLSNLRGQIAAFEIGENITGPLNELKNGSRELSNQLDVPGYAYHDGIYSATKGAQDLNAAIGELEAGVGEALGGVDQLNEGAGRLKSMAEQNAGKVDAVQRALPAAAAAPEEEKSSLAPVVALMIAALSVLIGAVVARTRWFYILGGLVGAAAAAGIVAFAFATNTLPASTVVAIAGVAFLGAAASAAITRALVGLCGPTAGMILAAVLGLAQLAVCAFLLKDVAASDGQLPGALSFIANLMPVQWASTGMTVLGNGGQPSQLWTALVVLGAVAIIGLASRFIAPSRADEQRIPEELEAA